MSIMEQRTLEALQYAVQQAISERELTGVRFELEHNAMLHHYILRLVRTLYADRLPSKTDDVYVKVSLPWRHALRIELPRTWLQRFLRRPAKHQNVVATGVAHGRVRVWVTGEYLNVFPDFKAYPKSLGEPVHYIQYSAGNNQPYFEYSEQNL